MGLYPYKYESTLIKTIYGDFEFCCFNWGEHEDDCVLCLRVPTDHPVPLVRLQSACFTAEIFRSTDYECHEQLEVSLHMIQREGGNLVYMLRDGRGAGIFLKTKSLKLGITRGLDTADAYDFMGLPLDPRRYDRAACVLKHFGISSVRLLTNNPYKISGLEAEGIEVERVPLEIPPTRDSLPYLQTKKVKMGHFLRMV